MNDSVQVERRELIGACQPHECNVVRESMRLQGYEPEFFPDEDGWVYWHARKIPKTEGVLLRAATAALLPAPNDIPRVQTQES